MSCTDVIVVGGGPAGLALSRCLADYQLDHLVLERGRVGERWRSERWDSLRLLTPNWMTRLPRFAYEGPDPNGFMPATEVASFLERYASSFAPPLLAGTTVERISRSGRHFVVDTSAGPVHGHAVVIATGQCGAPIVPNGGGRPPAGVLTLHPVAYKNPDRLPPGGVLVVGASSSGVQIADELARAGRDVVLSVGTHARVPRSYRGADIMGWLDRVGFLAEPADPARDLSAARAQPSFQLIGSAERRSIDLGTLRAAGVRLAGRFAAFDGDVARFASDLGESIAAAQSKLDRLLDRIDAFCRDDEPRPAATDRPPPITVDRAPNAIDLRASRIGTIVWATGSKPVFPRIDLPVFDDCGALVHDGGATKVPGLYFLGLKLQRRRNSTFLHGVGQDAQEIADELADAFSCAPRAA